MERFKTFSEIFEQSDLEIHRMMSVDARGKILESIVDSGFYETPVTMAFSAVVENNLTDKLFEGTLNDSDIVNLINEADIVSWFKDKAEKIKDKSKDALTGAEEFVKKVGGKFSSVAKLIGEALSTFLKKAWEFIRKNVNSALEKTRGKTEEAAETASKNLDEKEVKGVGSEISDGKKIMESTLNYFIKGMSDSAAKGTKSAGQKVEVGKQNEAYLWEDVFEQGSYLAIAELIKEDSSILNEIEAFDISAVNEEKEGLKIPFISKIVHWIADNVPPFSWLSQLEKLVAKATGWALEKFSIWASKFANAPGPRKFPNLSKFSGFFAGAKIKAGTKEIIKFIAKKGAGAAVISAFPAIGPVLAWMKKIATWLWYFEILEAAIDLAVEASTDKKTYKKLKDKSNKSQITGKKPEETSTTSA
tara:strand:- start:924 stop:2177 length:1254 start_codon:yes stop_codon:yes gene_type:complete